MKKILIIEDNEEVRGNLSEILELSNYTVITAENGKIGVQKALEEVPDLILCDIMMPILNGYGVLHILNKKSITSNIPFVFLTSKTDKSDFRKGMNLGADDYITKPFDDVELLDAIEMRLKKSKLIKEVFDGTEQGLQSFINIARGQKGLKALSKENETKRYRKKEILYQSGDIPKYLFFLVSGKVKTYKINEVGKTFITKIYNSGDFIGYKALLREEIYEESAMVIEDATLSFILKEDFLTLLYSNRDFSIPFIKMLANNMEENEKQLLKLAYNSIRKRVGDTLLQLQANLGRNEKSKIIILRDDLASIVGTAKESVIRTLADFKREGLISIDSTAITILDKKSLERLPN